MRSSNRYSIRRPLRALARLVASVALVLGLAAAATAQAPSDEKTRVRESTEAYVALVRADSARDQQDWDKALRSYQGALTRYQDLLKRYPDGETDIFEYRVTYCANQIKVIQDQAAEKAAPVVAPDHVVEPVEEEGDDAARALASENTYLRKRIAQLEGELETAESTGGSAEELERLRTANQALREALDGAGTPPSEDQGELRQQLDELQKELEAARQAKASGSGAEQVEELQADLEDLRRQNAGLMAQLGRTESEEQLLAQSTQLEELKTELETARKEVQRVDREKEGLARNLAKAEAQVAKLDTGGADRAQLAESNKKLKELEGSLRSQERKKADAEKRAEKLAGKADEMEAEMATLREQFTESESERKRLVNEQARLEKTTGAREGHAQKMEEELANTQAELKELKASVREHEQRAVDAEKRAGKADELEAEMAGLRAHLEESKAGQERLGEELAALKKASGGAQGLEADLNKMQARAGELEEERAQSMQRLGDMQKQMDEALSANSRLQKELEKALQHSDKGRRWTEEREARLKELEAGYRTSQGALARMQRENAALKSQSESRLREHERLEGRAASDATLVRELRVKNRDLWEHIKHAEGEAGRLQREHQALTRDLAALKALRQERLALLSENEALEKELEASSRFRTRSQELQKKVTALEKALDELRQ